MGVLVSAPVNMWVQVSEAVGMPAVCVFACNFLCKCLHTCKCVGVEFCLLPSQWEHILGMCLCYPVM